GKAATARAVADHGGPDLGYWAAAVDPEGRHHPIVNTEPRTDGTWLQGTSIPFSLATGGLWGVGGAWGAALVPIAGGLLAAWSARRLALRVGATPTAAEAAFWLVGLVGPVGFYALDLWEHAPAAGLVLLAASGLVDPRGRVEALVTGLAAGAAVVLRADAALVLVALGVAVLAVGPVRRRWLGHLDRVAVAGIAAVVPLVANALAERAVIEGDVRGSRAGDLVSGAGSDLAGRLGDAALQLAGPYADDNVAGAIAGLLLAAAAIGLALVAIGRWRAPAPVVRALAVLLGALYLGRIVQGLGFVPGALAVAPLAATGIAAGLWGRDASPERRVVTFGAVGSLPLIWALQWQGNHAAAWGARYLLASAALLVVVGVVALFEDPVPRLYRTAVLGLTVAVGVAGLSYHAVRTRQVADAFDQISVPEDGALVSADVNLLREGGGWYERDARWLTAVDPVGEVLAPGSLGDELELDTVAVVVRPAAVTGVEEAPGWERVDARDLELPGGRRVLLTLRRTGG
ncbi:MAG: hypothetical protein KDA98_15595, partial [Acidimicrobiales bacterium]|nr:hypothetical protein [Acidimicrobiales bacterium]